MGPVAELAQLTGVPEARYTYDENKHASKAAPFLATAKIQNKEVLPISIR